VKGMVLYDINVYVKPAARSSDSRHLALFAALGFLKAAGIPLKDIAYEGSIEASDVTSQLRNQQVRQRIIEQLPFFSMLAAHEHAYLAEQSQPRFFHQEQTLFNAGEEGNSMFVVLEGRLDVLAVKAQETTHIATLWPRDILGEMSLLTGAKRSATVRAVMPSVVMEICKPALSTLLRDNPLLAQGFAEQVAARELANRDRLEVATRNDATMRPSTLLSQITAFFSLSRV
jgi:CRP-like cAMP-binding protein